MMPSLWYKSRSVEWINGEVADGAQAYFFLGGVFGTPITVYQDAAQTTPHENPVEADGNGRWPAVYIPFIEAYGVQVSDEDDVQIWLDDNIPNPDPVEVSVTIPDTERVQTGQHIWEPVSAVRDGYVRANGRTIGNASSSATERANADTADLFAYLWNGLADTQAPVSGGRGGSAAADFAANKRIELPDLRGRFPLGLDDMGNSAAGILASVPFTHGNATTAGSSCGENTHALSTAELATHLHAVSITSGAGSAHTHTLSGTSGAGSAHGHTLSGATSSDGAHTHDPGTLTGTGNTASHSHTIGSSTNVQAGVVPVISASGAGNNTSSESVAVAVNVDGGATASGGSHTHSAGTLAANNESAHTHGIGSFVAANESAHTHSVSGNTGNQGSGTAHNIVSRALLGTWYIKL